MPTLDSKLLYAKIGEKVKDVRERAEVPMSQQQLAEILGLTRTSVTNIERGNQKVTLETLYKLSEHFKIEVSELLPAVGSVTVSVKPMNVEFGDKVHSLSPMASAVVRRLSSASVIKRRG